MEIVNKKTENALRLKYILADVAFTILAWILFNLVRQNFFGLNYTSEEPMYWVGLFLYTIGWLGMYALVGCYNAPYSHSRVSDILTSFISTGFGCVILFFAMILNDVMDSYAGYTESFLILFVIQFTLNTLPKLGITTYTLKRFDRREIIYPTLIVGNGKRAKNISKTLENHHSNGFYIIGYAETDEDCEIDNDLIVLKKDAEGFDGGNNELQRVIKDLNVKNVIIAPDKGRQRCARQMLPTLIECRVNIFLISDSSDFAIGEISDIFSIPLIALSKNNMPLWEKNFKWLFDKLLSIIAIVTLFPLLIFTAIMIKQGSEGPVIYRQKRIGLKGKPFNIYKFRSMYVSNVEGHNLRLTGDDDPRIVGKWGHIMRKYRIDELPQFFNVLKGDMSLVGFRPEQPYFVEKLINSDPRYAMLYSLRPGITSMGMVKYGYAKDTHEMLKRAQYDYLYIKNCSLAMDIKIIFYTIKTILLGKGK